MGIAHHPGLGPPPGAAGLAGAGASAPRLTHRRIPVPGWRQNPAAALLLVAAVGLGVASPSAAQELIPVEDRVDLIFDDRRDLLYITARDRIEVFDLEAGQLVEPLVQGGSPGGADITPDGNGLVVAQRAPGRNGVGHLDLVDLEGGAVERFTYPLEGEEEGGSYDVVALSNGTALFTAGTQEIRGVALRQVDLGTGVVTERTDAPGSEFAHRLEGESLLARSADRSLVFVQETGISSGPLFTYDPATDSFGRPVWSETSQRRGAVNRDGSLLAYSRGSSTVVLDRDLAEVTRLIGFDTGVFHPARDRFFGFQYFFDEIVALDTRSWRVVARIPAGENISQEGFLFDRNQSAIGGGGGGRWLALSVETGVRLYRLPPLDAEPAGLSIELFSGGAAAFPVRLANTAQAPVDWILGSADGDPEQGPSGWAALAPAEGSLGGGAAQDLAVAIDAAGLAPGEYAAEFRVETGDGPGEDTLFPVELTVLPVLAHPERVWFWLRPGQRREEAIELENLSPAPLAFSVSGVGEGFGVAPGEVVIGVGERVVWPVLFDPGNLPPRNLHYGGTVHLRFADERIAPAEVELRLTVRSDGRPLINPVPDLVLAAGTVAAAVDLHAAFDDAEDPDSALRFSLLSVAGDDLVESASVDRGSGEFRLRFNPARSGAAQLRVRATDTDGRSAEVGFNVVLMSEDFDADGLPDEWERHFLGGLGGGGGDDIDGDGLDHRAEFDAETDPSVADTDGDGLADGLEVDLGTGPHSAGRALPPGREGAAYAATLDFVPAGGYVVSGVRADHAPAWLSVVHGGGAAGVVQVGGVPAVGDAGPQAFALVAEIARPGEPGSATVVAQQVRFEIARSTDDRPPQVLDPLEIPFGTREFEVDLVEIFTSATGVAGLPGTRPDDSFVVEEISGQAALIRAASVDPGGAILRLALVDGGSGSAVVRVRATTAGGRRSHVVMTVIVPTGDGGPGSASAQPPAGPGEHPQITPVQVIRDEGRIRLRWPARPDWVYAVEVAESPTGPWSLVGAGLRAPPGQAWLVFRDGVSLPSRLSKKRFYRIRAGRPVPKR